MELQLNVEARMNITPRVKSARNRNIIVNVSIEIPSKMLPSHRSQETSFSPSPNKLKKRYKLLHSTQAEKKTLHSSNVLTHRETLPLEHPPSRKKYSNPTPSTTAHTTKGTLAKMRSCQVSPRRKGGAGAGGASRRGKAKVRNVSILEQVMGEDDIIKYTSNSNELRDKAEDLLLLENLGRKIDTHISEIDITEVRRMESTARGGKDQRERVFVRAAQDLLRSACAKKIQRAWRNYKTKKLIRSYSNDIRSKYLRSINISDDPKTTRSTGTGLRFKKKLLSYEEIQAEDPKEDEEEKGKGGLVRKIREDNMEKWQGLIEQIKNKKNIHAALEFSIQCTKELKKELAGEFFKADPQRTSPAPASPQPSSHSHSSSSPPPHQHKIIKTKKYYKDERQRWQQKLQQSNQSVKRKERVTYFQNQMLRLENEYSDSADSSLSHSLDFEQIGGKTQEEIENAQLRKKLKVFTNHFPQATLHSPSPSPSPHQHQTHSLSTRADIASIIQKKKESQNKKEEILGKEKEVGSLANVLGKSRSIQMLQFNVCEDAIEQSLSSVSQESLMETHRDWHPALQLTQDLPQETWRTRLGALMRKKDAEINQAVLQQLILQALIEVSQSQRLIAFIKGIHERSRPPKKAEGIVTNHSSIRDYINYFINYLIEYKVDAQMQANLLRPLGPSPADVLRYFRGEEIAYDPQTEYVMSIRIFNAHWEYANELIYFDKKWQDETKEAERVSYLKQLTKVFFRAIFDCFNESLQGLRIYGPRGKPYPWSQQRIRHETPQLKQSLATAYQRVLRCSLVFAGVLFEDKQHSLDEHSMQQILQSNMVKLITSEIHDDQPLWMFLEDELAEVKLEIAQQIEQELLGEVVRVVALRARLQQ